ncbi:MAG: pilus assembly protein [Chloroflexi bacterium]|nr:pilus assembly protein [Chloroflexota bacterium]
MSASFQSARSSFAGWHTPLRPRRGQAAVEFALILPVLILIVSSVFEFGRLFIVYSSLSNAAQEATRYAVASGTNGSGTLHFLDCAGIRAAAKRSASLHALEDGDIEIWYDDGDSTAYDSSTYLALCDGHPAPSLIQTTDRIVVSVRSTYQPMLLMFDLPPLPVTFLSARTIIKEVQS